MELFCQVYFFCDSQRATVWNRLAVFVGLLELGEAYPKHAHELQQRHKSEHDVFVIRDVDCHLHEDQNKSSFWWLHEEDVIVSLFACCERHDVFTNSPLISVVRFVRTYGSQSNEEDVNRLVRDPGIYKRERHMDGNKVQHRNEVTPIVSVLDLCVDHEVNHEFQ